MCKNTSNERDLKKRICENIAKNTRKEYEEQLVQSIISPANATNKNLLEVSSKKVDEDK